MTGVEQSSSDTPLVDCHAHIWTADMPLVANPRHRLNYDFTMEQYLQVLDDHGVRFAVIAAASPFGDYNDYTIACLRRTKRLRGTVILDPGTGQYELEGMARDGVIGVRLPFINRTELPDLGAFEYRRFLRRLRDLDWHVHLHIEGRKLPDFLPLLESSGVKIVIDHIGRHTAEEGVEGPGFRAMLAAIERGRTWVKLSGAYRLGAHATEHARALLHEVGPERLVWASDCPFAGHEGQFTYQSTINWLIEAIPDAAARRRIFAETPMALYFS
jgi:predicted TIM-barrel fold metal-dependent hydrolase